VIALGDPQRRQFLGRNRRHAVPPSDGLRLYRSGGAHSQQDISAKSITWDFAKPSQAIATLGEESGFEVINLLQPFRQDFLETGQ
jgi:hypothetical protein